MKHIFKSVTAILLAALLLIGVFPLTAFAEEDEPREPVQMSWVYTQYTDAQAQGGELPHGFILDDENPTVSLSFPPMRAPGKHFLGWNGLPEQAQLLDSGFTVLELDRDDFTVNEDGSVTSPYQFGTTLSARFESGTTVTFNGNGGKLNGMNKWIEEIPGSGVDISRFVPEWEGYVFTGWSDQSGNAAASLDGLTPDSVGGGSNYALTAAWQKADGFDYLYDENTKTLTIATDVGMENFPDEMTEAQLKSVEKLVMLEGVTALPQYSNGFRFSQLTALKTIVISPSVKNIYQNYFSDIASLEQVTIPASVLTIETGAFVNCPKLEVVTFGNNDADTISIRDTLSILPEAFKNCGIQEIHFPRQLQKLGSHIFEGCPLKDVYFQEARFRGAQYIYIEDTGNSASGSFDLAGTEVVLHFPESIAEKYKTMVIPNYADIINPPEGYKRYPVTVNGETFNNSKLQIACGDGYASFNPQTDTLTLNNADISKGNGTINYAPFDGSNMGINAACDDLTIVLQGTNSILGGSGEAYYDPEQDMWIEDEGGANGIAVKGTLTVTGSGSLTLNEDENAPIKEFAANKLTIDGTAVHMPGGIVSLSGNTIIKNSEFSFGELQITNAVSLTFQNSDVDMNGRLSVYSGEASVVFDGGDFSGSSQGDLFGGYADTNIIEYRGDTGILSGGWYGKGSIHIGAMETVTDEATGVKLGNISGASYTVTPLGADELSNAEAVLQKKPQYKDYVCAFGYEITVDPALTKPMTVYLPNTTPGVVFTCTEGDYASANTIISSTADGYSRFTTDNAGKFFFAVPGQAAEYEIRIAGVLPEDIAPTVILMHGDITEELSLNGDNEYTATIDNSHEAVVTVSASGYQTKTFRRAKGSMGMWSLGTITLEPIPSSGVIMTSVKSTDGRSFNSFEGLNPVINDEKKTLIEGTDYTLSYPYILLSADYVKGASANGSLTLTLTPNDNMALAPGTAVTTLKALTFGVTLTAWGNAEITVSSSFVSFNNILIFNGSGSLIESGTAYGGKTYITKALAEGGYTAVGFNSNTRFSSFGSLDDLQAAGLAEGKDYASASFSVQNGKTAKLSLVIPTLVITETDNSNKASISLHPGTVVLGAAFRVKVDYSLAQELDGNIVITLPDDSEVAYISEGNRIYPSAQVYNAEAKTVTVPVNGTENSLFIGMYVTEPGVHSVNVALSSGGSMTPLAGLSFNPAANVRVMAPQNTDNKGFTASLRGTANSQLKVELNGKPYATLTTNAAGSASVKIEIPAGVMNGDTLTLRAYDDFGEDTTKVNYYKKNATRLASLTAQYSNGTINFVKNGARIKNPHYTVTSSDYGDWWTLTSVLFGAPGALDTDNVFAQIMLSNGDFRTVRMTLTDSGMIDGEQRCVFKGMYFQNGYNNKPLPVNISLQYADKIDPVFIADTENRLDYNSLAGNREFLDSLDELNEETERQIAAITNQNEAQELIDSFRQSEAYKALSIEQQNAYNAAADSYQAPADEPFDMSDLLFDNVKISETEEFNDYSPEEQALILSMEKNTQDYIDAFSAFYKLKKPMNEYENMAEIWNEIGYTVTENYTAVPGKEYMQMDKAVWYYYDEENDITSVIDTEKRVRADVDYGKMERRNEEITEKLKAAFGIDSGKGGNPIGDGGDGDLSVDKAYEYIKDRVENQEEIEKADLVADYSNSAYEYFVGDAFEKAQDWAGELIEKYKESQSINYEKFLAEELAAGGDGTKALQQSERGVKFIANQEKLANCIDKTATGLDYLGDALAAWEIYKHNEDMNDYDEMIKQYNRVEDALWNSKLPYEDKLTLLNSGKEYVEAVMKLKGIARHERNSNIGQLTLSVVNKLVDDPIVNVGLDVVGVAVPALDNYKNELMRPSLEQTVQMKERRLLQLLEKAKRLETDDKKKKLDQQNIPYDDNIDLDFGIDIPPEVAEWYYEARMEEAEKRGIDVQPIMDPSGFVYEAMEDNALEGVTATVWYSPNEDGSDAVIWNAEDYDQENPQITGIDGSYAWDVPQGYWQVRFEKDGYEPAQTEWMPVPPPQLNIKTPMISTEKPQIVFAVAYPDFIEIEFSQYMDASRLPEIEGYEAEWTETRTATDGKELSKTLRLIPRNGVTPAGESIAVDIDGVQNYAGTALDHSGLTMTVTARPDRIDVPQNVQITYGDNAAVTVQVIGADELPMKNVTVYAVSGDPSVALLNESAITDDSGKAVFTLNGTDIGFAELTFTVDETNVSAKTQAVVFAEDGDAPQTLMIGDVNGDGTIDILDAVMIQKYTVDKVKLTPEQIYVADVNDDGTIDILDAVLIQKYTVDKISDFPKKI